MRYLNIEFLVLLLPIICIGGLTHLFWSRETLFQVLQFTHRPSTDLLFSYVTYAGNAIYVGCASLLVLAFRKQGLQEYGIALVISLILSALMVILTKQCFLDHIPRPMEVFGGDRLQLVQNIKLHRWDSFPSGHSATAVALFYILSFPLARRWRIAFVLLAVLVGYSRIYLNQHFVLDVAGGAFIGLASGVTAMYLGQILVTRKHISPSQT